MLEKPKDLELRATQDHFGFQLLGPVEKDWRVAQAMRTLLAVDAEPFRLVFAGGTLWRLRVSHGLWRCRRLRGSDHDRSGACQGGLAMTR